MSALALAPSLSTLSPHADSLPERRLLAELVERLRSRDDVVIDRVLRELVPEVRRWMLFHLGPRDDLDDAAQDALGEIAGALHRFEGRSSLATLARRITLRTSFRYYKRRREELAIEPSGGPDPERQVAARRALARLHVALAQLPERRRAAFVLCAVEELTPAEAADVLGVSANAMRSLVCRARQDLEALLAGDEELGGGHE
ncbi:MAG: RNA polymerase sigma factor [Sandaracinaceae bacterium]|nr:RNA polymerase sigma factor [Sandaracinaceae bacterium]